MCGYVGFTGNILNKEKIINEMMDKIIHRGPDESSVHSDDKVTLGFRRLSIVGLADGLQPMYNEDGSLVLVFNGEIYNYKSIKEELIKKGHIFKHKSDSEVLLHLYEEYGESMLTRLRGMFSFTIYDTKTDVLFSARDHFGIKPYYYTLLEDGTLLFGSEIKSFTVHPNFKKELNTVALENYLTFQYSVLSETFFKGVFKLPAAHYLTFKDGKLKVQRYWKPIFKNETLEFSDVVERIDNAIQKSIDTHKDCEVPIGSFLSSGVDSSYVVAASKVHKTFTVGFDYENYNEIPYAKELSDKLNIEHHSKIITTDEYWDSLGKVQYYMDEPLADPSAVSLYFTTQLAATEVKSALSGEGADEFFGGYNIYKEPVDLKILTSMPMFIRRFLGAVATAVPFKFKGKNLLIRASQNIEQRFIGNAKIFTKEERESILKNPSRNFSPASITAPFYSEVKTLDDITKMQYIDINLWMVGDILLKADKMAMANSLEVRVPLLDKEVFCVASKIPTEFKITKGETKFAFRAAAKRYIPDIVAKKKKLGFPVPLRLWLKEDKYYEKVKSAFMSETGKKYFNTDNILKYLDRHKSGKEDNSRKIWTIYTFLVWHEQYF